MQVLELVHSSAHRHRHQSDHECEKLELPKPRMAATQKLVRDIIGKYQETCFIAFCIAIYLLVPKLLLLVSAFQCGRHC